MTHPHKPAFVFICLLLGAFSASAEKAPPPKVVFLGDATIYNWGLPANASAFQANPKWNNQGLTGKQTSAQMLNRFQSDVVSHHPAIVHIVAGSVDVSLADDANRPFLVQAFETNMIAMVAAATHARIKVILGTIPPLLIGLSSQQPQTWYSFQPDLVLQLNAWIESYGVANDIPVVNYHDLLCACVGSTNPAPSGAFPLMSSDGSTPSASGYAAMTPLIEIALATSDLALKSGYLGNPGNLESVLQGNALQFTAYGVYSDGIPRPLLNTNFDGLMGNWSSSNPSAVFVGYNGDAFALAPGEATITFTSLSGVPFASWSLTVEPFY